MSLNFRISFDSIYFFLIIKGLLESNNDLNYVKNKNNNLHIGSATPINDILPILENIYPTFAKMFERYGSEQIRNTASLEMQYFLFAQIRIFQTF